MCCDDGHIQLDDEAIFLLAMSIFLYSDSFLHLFSEGEHIDVTIFFTHFTLTQCTILLLIKVYIKRIYGSVCMGGCYNLHKLKIKKIYIYSRDFTTLSIRCLLIWTSNVSVHHTVSTLPRQQKLT